MTYVFFSSSFLVGYSGRETLVPVTLSWLEVVADDIVFLKKGGISGQNCTNLHPSFIDTPQDTPWKKNSARSQNIFFEASMFVQWCIPYFTLRELLCPLAYLSLWKGLPNAASFYSTPSNYILLQDGYFFIFLVYNTVKDTNFTGQKLRLCKI